MRILITTAIIALMSTNILAQNPLGSTKLFEFHSNYWVNLHHFLYQKAKGSQLAQLRDDGLEFRETGEALVKLSGDENLKLEDAVAYYKENLIDKNLRSERLRDIKAWLHEQKENQTIVDTTFSKRFTDLLNSASSVYRIRYWPIHQKLNKEVLDQHISTIATFEERVIGTMEEIAEYEWQDSTKVRVELTAYANYAGAYTTTRPNLNIIISTIDPYNKTTAFVETVYHEGAHLLFNFQDSPFRGEIYHQAKALGMDFPRNLWHASMFYLCGRATQDALEANSVQHKMLMDVYHIFTDYDSQEFRNILENYYNQKIDLKSTVSALLANLQEDRR